MKGLVDLAAVLANRGIGLRSLIDGIDTGGTAGKLVFYIMAAMEEMERDLVREGTTAALVVARSEGRVGGRKTVMTPERLAAARKLLASGMQKREMRGRSAFRFQRSIVICLQQPKMQSTRKAKSKEP